MVKFYRKITPMPINIMLGVSFQGEDRVLAMYTGFHSTFDRSHLRKCSWLVWEGGFILEKCDSIFKEISHMFFLTFGMPQVRKLVKSYMQNPREFMVEAKSFKKYYILTD